MTGRPSVPLILFLAICLAAVLAFLATMVGRPGDAGAAAGWSEPQVAPDVTGLPSAVVDGDGTVHVAWAHERRGRWSLHYRTLPRGGTWTATETVVAERPWRITGVAVDADGGHAAVAWNEFSRNHAVLLASRRRGGRWEPGQALAPVVNGLYEIAIGVDARGGVTLAWTSFGRGSGVSGVHRPADASHWTDPVHLGGSGYGTSGAPGLDVAPDGRVLAVAPIGRRGTQRARLVAFEIDAQGAWTRGATIERGDYGPSPSVSLTPDGAVAAWQRFHDGGETSDVMVAELRGRRWGRPIRVDGGADDDFGGVVAAHAGDAGLVAWTRWRPRPSGVAIRAATIEAGSVLVGDVAETRIPDLGPPAPSAVYAPPSQLRIAGSDDGALLGWSEATGTADDPRGRTTTSTYGTGWQSPESIPGESSGRSLIALGVGAAGEEAVLLDVSRAGGTAVVTASAP